jgi:hypothetical protein
LPFAGQFRRLKSVHVGHAYIEEDHCKIPVEEKPEGLLAGPRPDEILAEVFENGLKGDKVCLLIIDEKDI